MNICSLYRYPWKPLSMRHWLRDFPGTDDRFINEHLARLETLYIEREQLRVKIAEAEAAAIEEASARWGSSKVIEFQVGRLRTEAKEIDASKMTA